MKLDIEDTIITNPSPDDVFAERELMLSFDDIDRKLKSKKIDSKDVEDLQNDIENDEALIRLGKIYRDIDAFKDLDKAIECFSKVKRKTVWTSIWHAESLFMTRDPENIRIGVEELEATDNPNAYICLSKHHSSGEFIEQDLDKAIEYADKALGTSKWAPYVKSDCLVKRGNREDFEEAIRILKDEETTDSRSRLSKIYLDERFEGRSLCKSVAELMRELEETGNIPNQLMNVLFAQKSAFYRDLAMAILEKEAKKGNISAMKRLAQTFKYGVNAPYDPSKALEWIQEALSQDPQDKESINEYADIIVKYVRMRPSYSKLVDDLDGKIFDNENLVLNYLQACIFSERKDVLERTMDSIKGFKCYGLARRCLNATVCGCKESDLATLDEIREPFHPQDKEYDVCVMYAVDDNYARFATVSMMSVIKNSGGRRVRIFVATNGLSKNTQYMLDRLDADITVKVVDTTAFNELESDMGIRYNKIKFACTIPQEIVPEDVERLLYLGADTVVDGDLRELFDADLEGKALFALTTVTEARKLLDNTGKGKSSIHGCFFFYDMKEVRSLNLTAEKLVKVNRPEWTEEQHLANFYGAKRIKYIDFLRFGYRVGYTSLLSKNKMRYLLPKPVTIHYVGMPKPWSIYYEDGNVPPFMSMKIDNSLNEVWWRYARMMPQENYNEIRMSMKNSKSSTEFLVKKQYVQDRLRGDSDPISAREAYDADGLTRKAVEGLSYGSLGIDFIYYTFLMNPRKMDKVLDMDDLASDDRTMAELMKDVLDKGSNTIGAVASEFCDKVLGPRTKNQGG